MNQITLKELKSDLLTLKGCFWYILISILLSILSYLFLTNIELSVLDQRVMVFYMIEVVLALSILRAIVYGSDSFAGEIERGTMEILLLTPLKKTSIAFGKFIASIVNWLILFVISIPYIFLVGTGIQSIFSGIAYLFFLGTLLVIIFTSFSMILSVKLKSVKTALIISILVFFLLGITMIIPGLFKQSYLGHFVDIINPVSAAVSTFDSVVVDNEGFSVQLVRLAVILIYSILTILLSLRIVKKNELVLEAQ